MSPLRKAMRWIITGALTAALLTGLLIGAAVIDSRMLHAVEGKENRLSITRTDDGIAGTLFGLGYQIRFEELLPVAF